MAIRIKLSSLALAAAGLLALAVAGLAAFVYFGMYNVAATSPHARLNYWLIETTGQRSIKWRARNIAVPDLSQAGVGELAKALENPNRHRDIVERAKAFAVVRKCMVKAAANMAADHRRGVVREATFVEMHFAGTSLVQTAPSDALPAPDVAPRN